MIPIIADTEKGHILINAYSALVSKLYCKPEKDTSVGSFIESESKVNLKPKTRKSQKKNTTTKKYEHKEEIFTEILRHQEANDETEIDSD